MVNRFLNFDFPSGSLGMKSGIAGILSFVIGLSALHAAVGSSKPDEILASAKGWTVTRADLDKSIRRVETELMTTGSLVQEDRREEFEGRLLDQLILVQISRVRATEADRQVARTNADAFIHAVWAKSGSDADYERRLARAGYTREDFSQEKYDEALVNALLAREVKKSITITPDAIRKWYNDHPDRWKQGESVKVAQLLLTVRDPVTGEEFLPDVVRRKYRQIQELRDEAQKPGADFANLVREYSEEIKTKASGGELVVFRGQTPLEFESACFSLEVGKVSDVVTSAAGYHLIKCLQKSPASRLPLEKVRDEIRDELVENETLKQLPQYAERLRREAGMVLSPSAPKLPAAGPGRPPSEK